MVLEGRRFRMGFHRMANRALDRAIIILSVSVNGLVAVLSFWDRSWRMLGARDVSVIR